MYHKAQTVNGVACSMSCALDNLLSLDIEDQSLDLAKNHLSEAVFLMDQYYRTWHSIIWVRSDNQTKRQTSEKLNNLAFDGYQHFCHATENLNKYIDSQIEKEMKGETVAPPPQCWKEMNVSLSVAHDCFQREHKFEIFGKQLTLF